MDRDYIDVGGAVTVADGARGDAGPAPAVDRTHACPDVIPHARFAWVTERGPDAKGGPG